MAIYDLAVWSPQDFGITSQNYQFLTTSLTLQPGAEPTVIEVNDTDSQGTTFNDGQPGNAALAPSQTFSGTIDGRTYTNTLINPERGADVYDQNGNLVGQIYTLTIGNSASFNDFIGYATNFAMQPGVTYTLDQNVAAPNVAASELYVCFTPGTLIAVPGGERPVESLRPGDLVLTKDHGAQPLCWVGRRDFTAADLAASPGLRPIVIAAGAFGPSQPAREVRVSPLHRILVRDDSASLLFGTAEVLIAARDMIDGDAVRWAGADEGVTYVHLLFDGHEIVFADGCEAESFHPNAFSLRTLEDEARDELLAIFPELARRGGGWRMARPALKGHETSLIGARGRMQ